MTITKKLANRIQRFLDAHDQHDVTIKIHGREARERGGGEVELRLDCFNGYTWEGLRKHAKLQHFNRKMNLLLDEADEHCPAMGDVR